MKKIFKILSFPFKYIERASEKRSSEFLKKVKKPYSDRTTSEKIIFDAYYKLKIEKKCNHLDYLEQ